MCIVCVKLPRVLYHHRVITRPAVLQTWKNPFWNNYKVLFVVNSIHQSNWSADKCLNFVLIPLITVFHFLCIWTVTNVQTETIINTDCLEIINNWCYPGQWLLKNMPWCPAWATTMQSWQTLTSALTCPISLMCWLYPPPCTTKLLGGYIGFTRSVCPSIHPTCCVHSIGLLTIWQICLICGTDATHEGRYVTYHFQVDRSKVKVTWVIQIIGHLCSMAWEPFQQNGFIYSNNATHGWTMCHIPFPSQ